VSGLRGGVSRNGIARNTANHEYLVRGPPHGNLFRGPPRGDWRIRSSPSCSARHGEFVNEFMLYFTAVVESVRDAYKQTAAVFQIPRAVVEAATSFLACFVFFLLLVAYVTN
jgi:hypothetical protein